MAIFKELEAAMRKARAVPAGLPLLKPFYHNVVWSICASSYFCPTVLFCRDLASYSSVIQYDSEHVSGEACSGARPDQGPQGEVDGRLVGLLKTMAQGTARV